MSSPVTHDEERQVHEEFASQYGEQEYRQRLADFYTTWHGFNERYFGAELTVPHLALGKTAPRSLGYCSTTTSYGGRMQLTLNERVVFGSNTERVVRAWPAAGSKRFIDDLLLRLTVRQFVLEVKQKEEASYRGFGPVFVAEANRIGKVLGLGPVVARNRGTEQSSPVACGWPHCVRPEGYYGDDITEAALALACGGSGNDTMPAPPPSQGTLELMRYLDRAGRREEAWQMLERHLAWTQEAQQTRWRRDRAAEAGDQDVDGRPLGKVACARQWLEWNGGTVARMAQSIEQCRSFVDLPLLADALLEAGCRDERILRHLRTKIEHNRRCWVLRLLLADVD